jgi:hypothetical protein
MSAIIEARVAELLWKQWTVLGVAGVASPAKQAIDLEALIAFTRFAAPVDPRLVEESMDWCARIGRGFVSLSRLRQILRTMPPPPGRHDLDLPSMLIDEALHTRRLSHKSRQPSLDHPSLLQLRSRFIFGVGARADVVARLAMQGRIEGGRRASEIGPSGYTKVAIATVLDQLAQAGVIHKLARGSSVRYELTREVPLRSLLAPLPRRMPPWAERYAMVAAILEGWRKYGSRRTYAVELAKIVDGLRDLAAAAGHRLPLAEPARLVSVVDRWANSLLDDEIWETSWNMKGEDLAPRILGYFTEPIVQAVLEDDYPVGHTELSDFQFRVVDERKGAAEFVVEFTAEHHREDFHFQGHVEGTFHFDPASSKKQDLLESLELEDVRAHFNMDDESD